MVISIANQLNVKEPSESVLPWKQWSSLTRYDSSFDSIRQRKRIPQEQGGEITLFWLVGLVGFTRDIGKAKSLVVTLFRASFAFKLITRTRRRDWLIDWCAGPLLDSLGRL